MNAKNKGRKNDQNKLRYDLIPPQALEEIVKVYTMGTQFMGRSPIVAHYNLMNFRPTY